MKYLLYYICLPVLFYPTYFVVANTVDSIVGDQQLINWLYFDSRSVLLKTFFKDWLSALPKMFITFYLVILPIKFLSKKVFNSSRLAVYFSSLAIVIGGSYLLGFRELGLVINALAIFFVITLDYFSNFLLFSQSKK